ncbi:relaxase/mobilization nuclease domain-containing protein [Acinetobacter sp. YH16032]|uniref:relaxase/mobilization nuclease domain-containing protein n=1 Tax=Acinetobacter sp. YH16032 TaxID=2601181 RepID=UPI0015D45C43|nr:relaxase/mobilization nuclease domain-containing protein [Acinetobacter sp. YH16032]
MHIKFTKHGKGCPRKAVGYLLAEKDAKGDLRPDIQTLRGDAQTFVAITESLDFDYRYSSAVIAWSKQDNPSDAQIQETLDQFEKHAFADLDPTRYHMNAVLHVAQDGSKHVHVLVPRVDLGTGKSLNIAPPGHEKYFDKLRDYLNEKYTWSKPDDLAILKADVQLPHHTHSQRLAAIEINFAGKTKPEKKELLNKIVAQRINAGVIQDRNDVVQTLAEYGIITRNAKDTISVKLHGDKTAVKLAGEFYKDGFNVTAYAENRARAEADQSASRANEVDAKRVNELYNKLQRATESRARFFADRYAETLTDHRQRDTTAQSSFDQQNPRPNGVSLQAHTEISRVIESSPNFSEASRKLEYSELRATADTATTAENQSNFVSIMHSVTANPDHNFIGEVNERINSANQSASQSFEGAKQAATELHRRTEDIYRAIGEAQRSTTSTDERRATSGLFERIYQRILKTNAGLFGKNLNQCLEGIKYRSVSPRQDQSANSADAQRYSGYSIEINTDPFTDFYRQLTSKYHRSQRTLNDFGRLTERFDHTIKESNRVLTAINSKGFAIKPKSPIDAARIFSYSYVSAAKDVKYWAEIQELKYHKKNPMGTELYEAICEKYNALQHFSRQEKDMTDQMRDHIQQMIANDKRMVKFAEKRLGTYFSQREHDRLDSLFDTAKDRFKKPVEVSQVRDIEPTPTPTPSPSKDDGYRYDPF